MKNRKARLEIIAHILSDNIIGSQDDLLRHLSDKGISVTQATLSRDLKKLNTTKVSTDLGGYRYVLNNPAYQGTLSDSNLTDPHISSGRAALSLVMSGNIVVIKTRYGYASGLAYDIDMLHSEHIIGTLPGSDTVLAICNENSPRPAILELLKRLLPFEVIEKAYLQLA